MRKNYKKCKVKLVERVYSGIEIKVTDIEFDDKYIRAKKKQQDRKEIERKLEEWENQRNI